MRPTADAMNLLQGTLDVLVLNALAKGPLHGYGVVAWIRRATDDALQVEDGALYTALHRMEKRGWLAPEWGVSPKGRRAELDAVRPRRVARIRGEARGLTWRRGMGRTSGRRPGLRIQRR